MTDENNEESVTFSSETTEESRHNTAITSIEEGLPSTSARSLRHCESSLLSMTSKLYDIRGEGHLDETEQTMRAMDHEGRGYLSNAQVYQILQDQSRMQQALSTAKRLLVFFAALLVILAVANIGIAFAAAKLAKDTTVQGDVLVVKGTDNSVATNTHADLYDLTTAQQVSSNGSNTTQVLTTMERSDAEAMYASCIGGGSVNLVRTWPGYRFNDVISLCPADSYPRIGDTYNFAYASGSNVQVDCSTDPCVVSGGGLLQEVEQDCVYDQDCATNNCFFETWIPDGDPGTCKCNGDLGCALNDTCVDSVCQGPNADNGNIVV